METLIAQQAGSCIGGKSSSMQTSKGCKLGSVYRSILSLVVFVKYRAVF